jgi:hypothetical protein
MLAAERTGELEFSHKFCWSLNVPTSEIDYADMKLPFLKKSKRENQAAGIMSFTNNAGRARHSVRAGG